MPIYTYFCVECIEKTERVVDFDDRDNQFCEKHPDVKLARKGVEMPADPVTNPRHFGAVTTDGRHIPGHFGRDAARKKR